VELAKIRRPSAFAITAWAIILLGGAVRLREYFANRSLWLDEAMLALNVVAHPFRKLLGQLQHGQIAPVGFLVLDKAATVLIGNNEFGLRLVPLLGGIASLVLFYYLTRGCLSRKAGLVALAMFAFSSSLTYYSSEAKPYSTDATVAVALLLAGYSVVLSNGDIASLMWLGLVGAIGIVLSFPSVLILGGFLVVSISYWFASQARRDNAIGFIIVGVAWLAMFLPLYLVRSRPAPGMYGFWEPGFLPQGASWVQTARWLIGAPFSGLEAGTLGLKPFCLVTIAFCVGCWSLWLTARKWFFLLLSPIALALLAAVLKLYPMTTGRLLLFLVPAYLIVIAAGLDYLYENTSAVGSAAAVVLTLVLVVPAFHLAVHWMRHPYGREEMKAVLDYIALNEKPGDEIYVYGASQAAFDFYAQYWPQYQLGGMTIVRGVPVTADTSRYEPDLQQLKGLPRAWILISHWEHSSGTHRRLDDQKTILTILDRMGKRVATFQATGAAAYLYNLAG
jgi:hypothetical protein